MIILYENDGQFVILMSFGKIFTVILQWGVLVATISCALILVFSPLSYTQVKRYYYRDNYHIVINLMCNNRDRQYIKYLISHITRNINLCFQHLLCSNYPRAATIKAAASNW